MTRIETQQKVAEVENWLTCDCPVCSSLRKGLGERAIREYIARLKAGQSQN